ncbi:hypothetical protein [uncultured Microscilla sp.]|uniref:leucine-rich repeat domain-containing protein n=1 Tax=uncultured Microscilla sp. TaxID=432653 RepID=UPI00261924EE|nr:hypothetical protein [uncultured Microscilla sp.]
MRPQATTNLSVEEIKHLFYLLTNDNENNIYLAFTLMQGVGVPQVLYQEMRNSRYKRYLCLKMGLVEPLQAIDILRLSNLNMPHLPQSIGDLPHLSSLDVSFNALKNCPESLGNLLQLKVLHLQYNQLQNLSVTSIGQLKNLQYVSLVRNQLQVLPPEIGQWQQMRELDLTSNLLQALPSEIGNLHRLVKLQLRNNQLSRLPKSIQQLQHLKALDIRYNPLPPMHIQQVCQWLPHTDVRF